MESIVLVQEGRNFDLAVDQPNPSAAKKEPSDFLECPELDPNAAEKETSDFLARSGLSFTITPALPEKNQ